MAATLILAPVLPFSLPALAATPIATVHVGTLPTGIAVNPATNRIYVANTNDGTVSVINGATNAVVATITVGSSPFGVAVNPVTNGIYVSWYNFDGSLVVINGATNQVITDIPLQHNSLYLAVNTVTNRIYVANQSGNAVGNSNDDGSLSVVDGATNTVLANVTVGAFLEGVAVDEQTQRVYINNLITGLVSVFDAKKNVLARKITLPPLPGGEVRPLGLAFDPHAHQLYTAGLDSGVLYAINSGNKVTSILPGLDGPVGVGVNTASGEVYIANGGNVTAVNPKTNSVDATLPAGSGPALLAVNSSTNRIYVANQGDNTVTVLQGVR
jgi:YVTN family beta-propeller protein